MRVLLVLSFIATICGCASPTLRAGAEDPARVTQSINLSGFPPEYKQGFASGCEAASGRGAQRPKGAGADAQGWQDGFDYCKPRTAR